MNFPDHIIALLLAFQTKDMTTADEILTEIYSQGYEDGVYVKKNHLAGGEMLQ